MNEKEIKRLTLLLQEWLQENKATIDVIAVAPKGGSVPLKNFLPDGWQAAVVIVPKQEV